MNTSDPPDGPAITGDDPRLPIVRHRDPATGFRVLRLVEPAPGWRVVVRPWAYGLPGEPSDPWPALRAVPVVMAGWLHFGDAPRPEVAPLIETADGWHVMPLQFHRDVLQVAWLGPAERLSEHHADLAVSDLAREMANVPLLAQVGQRIDGGGAYGPGWLSWPAIARMSRRSPELVGVTSVPRWVGNHWEPDEIRLTTGRDPRNGEAA